MALKRITAFIPIGLLILTACMRQASPPVEIIAESGDPSPLIQQPTATDEVDTILVITNTPFTGIVDEPDTVEPEPTEVVETIIEPTEPPLPTSDAEIMMFTATPFPTMTDPAQVDPVEMVTSTPFVQATQPIVTPGSPLSGESAVTTPTPAFETENTPSGLTTPTDAFFPDDATETPAECIYVVRAGDTLFRIALNNNTTVDAIQRVNPGINPNLISPGQEIIIPDCAPSATPTSETMQATAPADSGVGTVPIAGTPPADQGIIGEPETGAGVEVTHTVQAGETLGGIARRYGVTVNAIATRNNLTNPNQLSVGQQLIIPAPGN